MIILCSECFSRHQKGHRDKLLCFGLQIINIVIDL